MELIYTFYIKFIGLLRVGYPKLKITIINFLLAELITLKTDYELKVNFLRGLISKLNYVITNKSYYQRFIQFNFKLLLFNFNSKIYTKIYLY